jgi:bifunctional oligoribonuclease and PAP phosphatase NrnA
MNDVIEILKKSNNIGITFHTSPDGDSLGSSLALMLGLRKLNKKAYIICKDKVPEVYKFLPGSNYINGLCSEASSDTECLIALDCGNVERLNGDFNIAVKEYQLLNIDHHLSNDSYGDINYVDTKASAVGEIIYNILHALDVDIDTEIATCLYTSIITDCGGFSFTNTTSNTHTIAADLIRTGINFNEIHRIIYSNKGLQEIKLLGLVINRMHLQLDAKLCIMELTKDMLESLNLDVSDTSDIISVGMEIDSVEVVAFFKERESDVKVSLRSKYKTDVRKVAETFGGGGHTKAAGFVLPGTIEEAKEIVLKHLEKELI